MFRIFAFSMMGVALAGSAAFAETVSVKGGTVTAEVSAQDMSRLVVQGEKITAIRTMDDPSGPRLLVQNDAASGDAFVGFDGVTAGRTFSLFLTTDAGETIQVLFHPGDGAAKTVELVPERKVASVASPIATSGYAETVVAFLKLMFNGQDSDGVTYTPADDKGKVSGKFFLRTIGYYSADGMRGFILAVTNRDTVPQALKAEQFMVKQVMAVGVSDELLQPGETAQVYVAEEAP